VVAGPNGSGKSTLTRSVHFEGRDRLLDPDTIARSLNPSNPSAAAIAAVSREYGIGLRGEAISFRTRT
jgi:predicted ABC-type ATPase